MQMLFQWDISHQEPKRLERNFWRGAKAADNTRDFANQLFEGAAREATSLDELIVKHAENWKLERMAILDRAILRLAMHELRTERYAAESRDQRGGRPGEEIFVRRVGRVCERDSRRVSEDAADWRSEFGEFDRLSRDRSRFIDARDAIVARTRSSRSF